VLVLVEADRVEDVELRLGPPVGGIGHAGALEILLGLGGHVARVAGVGLAGDRVPDEAVEDQGRVGPERVEDRRARVGDQDHVRLLDLLEPADRGTVEAVALLEPLLGQLVGRDREVLHQPGQVGEAEVHDLDLGVPDQVENVSDRFGQLGASLSVTWAYSDDASNPRLPPGCWFVSPE
jgi:hypothetical protein